MIIACHPQQIYHVSMRLEGGLHTWVQSSGQRGGGGRWNDTAVASVCKYVIADKHLDWYECTRLNRTKCNLRIFPDFSSVTSPVHSHFKIR